MVRVFELLGIALSPTSPRRRLLPEQDATASYRLLVSLPRERTTFVRLRKTEQHTTKAETRIRQRQNVKGIDDPTGNLRDYIRQEHHERHRARLS
jgi:hypothetical protein